MSDSGGGSFFLGFIVGVMAGAAAALLMTPQSGEELRRRLEQETTRLADDAKLQAQRLTTEAKGQVAHVTEQGRIIVNDTVRKAQDQVITVQTRVTGSAHTPDTF